jgi:hypothetical protein
MYEIIRIFLIQKKKKKKHKKYEGKVWNVEQK